MTAYIILKIKWDKEFFKPDWSDFIVVFASVYVCLKVNENNAWMLRVCFFYFVKKNKYYGKDFYIYFFFIIGTSGSMKIKSRAHLKLYSDFGGAPCCTWDMYIVGIRLCQILRISKDMTILWNGYDEIVGQIFGLKDVVSCDLKS